jgi:galactokinase
MTGGGFGGCTINLIAVSAVDEFTRAIRTGYAQATGRNPQVFVCTPADGAERIQ